MADDPIDPGPPGAGGNHGWSSGVGGGQTVIDDLKSAAKTLTSKEGLSQLGKGILHALGGGVAPATPKVANTTKGASAAASGSPVHQPVSQPGTQATHVPMKAAVGNRGHATTHPATPGTAQSTARHPKAQHATAKATGGTQHAGSHGAKAGHAAHKGGKKKSKAKK